MIQFINGAIMMAFGVAGVFFLRFWKRSRDRLFLMFSIAFFSLAINRIGLALLVLGEAEYREHQTALYVIRLAAFVLILIAIIDKNRGRKGDEALG